jgi:hypothetical protein
MKKTSYDFLTQFINEGKYKECAEMAHNKWLKEKKNQGWTYGEKRDEAAKTNPILVSYDHLPPHMKSANNTTPYAVANFFRTKLGKEHALDDLEVLFEELLEIKHKELLAELSEYIHSHFIITLISQGESTQSRQDMVVFEDLDNDTKSWDTHIALEVIRFLLDLIRK